MTAPFIIFALPRSRTKWLSEWLSYDGRKVGHDIALDCATPDEFLEKLSGLAGTVETGAMIAWRLIRARLPNAKIVTVRRPVEEVRASFARLGIFPNTGELEERDAMLVALWKSGGVEGYTFDQLNDDYIRAELFQSVLGVDWTEDYDTWDAKLAHNIQIDMDARMAYLAANERRIDNLKRLVREQEAALCLTSA